LLSPHNGHKSSENYLNYLHASLLITSSVIVTYRMGIIDKQGLFNAWSALEDNPTKSDAKRTRPYIKSIEMNESTYLSTMTSTSVTPLYMTKINIVLLVNRP
jgi:hypothetical protein